MAAEKYADWLAYSSLYLGYNENLHRSLILQWAADLGIKQTDGFDPSQDQDVWPTVFVAHCLKQFGIKLPKNHFNLSEWLTYGNSLKRPYRGALAIIQAPGISHVGFVSGITAEKNIVIRGGDQDDGIYDMSINPNAVTQYRWPPAPSFLPQEMPLMKTVRSIVIG